MSDKVVTRFPPSPTGYLHIGGARTALFNWLYARQKAGVFILRIEDTDKERSTDEATKAIIDSMEWLGLDWDEGPYFQSQRYHLYDEMIERLLNSGRAYYCDCSPEELERRRKEAMARGLKPKYDGRCRERGLGPGPGRVVRLKSPLSGVTQYNDLIKGPIRFDNEELDDLVLKRSDGSPTYHMAVVADDVLLGVTHVIRGDDHVNNTPRQIQIYEALGERIPFFAHVPMILGPDKTRLSKRHGAMSVLAYRDMGYLPDALINALARLGWSYGNQEKFTRQELIEKFSLEAVGKSAGVFNFEKLLDLNATYIRESPMEQLVGAVLPFLRAMDIKDPDPIVLKKALATLKARSKTLVDLAKDSLFYFQEEISYDKAASDKFLQAASIGPMMALLKRLKEIDDFSQNSLEKVFEAFLAEYGITLKALAQPLRVALTGRTASPGLFEVMDVLGKQKVLKRIERAISFMEGPHA
jgi:glutamyl-tRNA synthetase